MFGAMRRTRRPPSLHSGRMRSFLNSVELAVKNTSGIIIQFPLYAWTNQPQPFWALPLLGISGLSIKDIMPYCLVMAVWVGCVTSLILLFFKPCSAEIGQRHNKGVGRAFSGLYGISFTHIFVSWPDLQALRDITSCRSKRM